MEFGPRALGSRSILGDPRSNKMQKNLNLKIKYRESFRPFAPSILREDLSDWFDINVDSPYMLLVANINYNKNIDAENSLQLIYELDNGIFGSHTNHCGHDVTKWDLELIGPNLRLEANATEKAIKGTIQGKKINEKFGPNNNLGGLNKISAWLKSIQENNKSYIRSSYEESLNTQALIEAAIKSQNSNKMELVEKI